MNMDHILNANLFKVWSKFVMASVIGVVLNTIYTIIDGMFVGQGVGEIGLAAFHSVKKISKKLKSIWEQRWWLQ